MNVIVILTDSMRADHLGCHPLAVSHGEIKIQTPNLDKLAAEGTLFENAHAGSTPTIPMRMDCWKGTYGDPFNSWRPCREDEMSLAELLWGHGFNSALITDVYHMHKPSFTQGRGFDQVRWIRGQEYDPWILDESIPVDLEKWHRLKHGTTALESDERWMPFFEQYLRNRSTWKDDGDCFVARVVEEAMSWLDDTVVKKGQGDDLFLWVDCFDPHEPWDPPEPYWSMYMDKSDDEVQPLIDPVVGAPAGYVTDEEIRKICQLYAGEVTLVDKWVGDLLGHIESLGLNDNTLIMHLSDHGEPFNEHGIIRKPGGGLYEELTHIPWTIRHPEGIGRGKRVQSFAQPIDMMPTILDFLGIDGPSTAPCVAFGGNPNFKNHLPPLHGHSLLPLMRGEVEQVRDRAYSGAKTQWGIRTEEWTYLLPTTKKAVPGHSNEPELYNREADLHEQDNVIERHRDVAGSLDRELREWAARHHQ
jgi:arylsulfatase A-like enzyme